MKERTAESRLRILPFVLGKTRPGSSQALAAISQARGNLELLGKLAGELDERPVVSVLVSAEWAAIRATIVEVLGSYPSEVRSAVSEALLELEVGQR